MLSNFQRTLINKLKTRHGRKKSEYCLCEGLRCCQELFENHAELVKFVVCAEDFEFDLPQLEIVKIPLQEFRKISETVNSQGILAVAGKPQLQPPDAPVADSFVLLLENISDPGNMGTIIRTARAAGISEISYTANSVDVFSEKVIRAATGFQFSLRLRCFENTAAALDMLAALGYKKVFRTNPHEGESCFKCNKLFDKSVIVIGNEANGVSTLPQASQLTIPMFARVESLNAAQAATIILFESVRRRNNQ